MMPILMHGDVMRTTVTIDDELLARASELTGETERSALLRAGLATLVRVESARRLAALGGSDQQATAAPRRRDAQA
jgi:Arc/MetJ family transcription regulator